MKNSVNRELLEILNLSNHKALKNIARIRSVFNFLPLVDLQTLRVSYQGSYRSKYGSVGFNSQDLFEQIDGRLLGDIDYKQDGFESGLKGPVKSGDRALLWLYDRGFIYRYKGIGINLKTLAVVEERKWRAYSEALEVAHEDFDFDITSQKKGLKTQTENDISETFEKFLEKELPEYIKDENLKKYQWTGEYLYFRTTKTLLDNFSDEDKKALTNTFGLTPE